MTSEKSRVHPLKKILLLTIIPVLLAAFWEKKLGGLTAEQAFTDARVARLVRAASSGDLKEVDAQIRAGADVNAVGAQGVTPLMWVLTTHDLKAVEHLLKSGANPNYRDPECGISAMYFASGGNKPKLLELLLKHGGDPNLRGTNAETMLQVAASECRRENIDILLQHGADINGHDGLRRSAADSALTRACFDITVYLLERGLTYDLRYLAKGVEGRIIQDNSDQKRWQDRAIEILKERGVKFPANVPRLEREPFSKELWQALDQAFPDKEKRDAYIKKQGYPYNAYYALRLEKVMPDRAKREAWLNEYHKDARDAYNSWLLEHGDDRVAKIVELAGQGDFKGVDAVLREGAHVNMVNTDGATPLMRLAEAGNFKGAEYLLKLGADPNYKDEQERSALYTAAAKKDLKLLGAMLKRGGDPNLHGPKSDPLLFAVVRTGSKEGIDLLLKHGANINVDRWGNDSAADEAVRKGRLDLAAYLLERGLNKNLRELAVLVNSVQVPPGHRQQLWKEKVIEMLKARGVDVQAPAAGKGK